MNSSRGFWTLVVLVIIIILLGWWWIASSNNASMTGSDMSSSTTQTSTSTTGTTGSTGITTTDRSSSSVLSIAQSISGSSTFSSWLSSTGVGAQLTGKGPYTVFVPTNGSVGQLPAGTFTNLSAAEQKRFVQYHVVSGRAIDVNAEKAGVITALSKDPLNFSTTNNIPMVNSSIVIAEYKGSNGIVYVIDNPLIPPKK